jgi:hypothetical protein
LLQHRIELNGSLENSPDIYSTALHDVHGYTDDAREVLRRTSTAMAGRATIRSMAPVLNAGQSAQVGFIA